MSGHNASRVPVAWSAKRERHRPSRVPYERVGRQRRALLRAAVAGEAFAAAHLEAAPRALEGAVAPLHRRCTPRAWLDHWLGSRRGGRRRGHAADGTARGGRRVERWVPRYPLGTPTCTGACTPSRPAPRSRPPSQELRNAALVPPVARREPSRGRVSSFPYRSKRRRADSNRCTRLCRPLPNHSATSPGTRMVAPQRAAARAIAVVACTSKRPSDTIRTRRVGYASLRSNGRETLMKHARGRLLVACLVVAASAVAVAGGSA